VTARRVGCVFPPPLPPACRSLRSVLARGVVALLVSRLLTVALSGPFARQVVSSCVNYFLTDVNALYRPVTHDLITALCTRVESVLRRDIMPVVAAIRAVEPSASVFFGLDAYVRASVSSRVSSKIAAAAEALRLHASRSRRQCARGLNIELRRAQYAPSTVLPEAVRDCALKWCATNLSGAQAIEVTADFDQALRTWFDQVSECVAERNCAVVSKNERRACALARAVCVVARVLHVQCVHFAATVRLLVLLTRCLSHCPVGSLTVTSFSLASPPLRVAESPHVCGVRCV
jgi:hypothetical protein